MSKQACQRSLYDRDRGKTLNIFTATDGFVATLFPLIDRLHMFVNHT